MTHWSLCAQVGLPKSSAHRSAGFGLVELMVAVVIGLLGIIVMMQMFAVFEEQKRTTIGGDDALTAGAIALNGLEQDIEQAGWGLSSVKVLGCSITGLVPSATIPLAPVVINPAGITGDANTDTLMVVSGNTNGTVEGVLINSQPATGDPVLSASTPNVYALQAVQPFAVGDKVFALLPALPRAASCTLVRTAITGVNRPNVAVSAGIVGMGGGRLYNLGATPSVRVYAIRSGNLSVCDYIANDCTGAGANTWVDIASNVVSMRVQYGRDTTDATPVAPATNRMDGVIDVWDKTIATTATPISTVAAKNVTECAYARISGLRLALVARSSQPEKPPSTGTHVTAALPVWAGSDAAAIVASASNASAAAFDLPSPDASWPTWQDFRYKVFQALIPLRNISVMGAASEC